jgi:mono/diheme cytochrome c family protein
MKMGARILMLAGMLSIGAFGQDLTGNAARGKELFFNFNCYSCHGYSGQNGPGNRLVPMKMSQAAFMAYIRKPARMPTYSAQVLTDQQAADIWAHIKSLPAGPDAKDIPLLQDIIKSSK